LDSPDFRRSHAHDSKPKRQRHCIANRRGHAYEHNRRKGIEGANRDLEMNHMRAEYEVVEHLSETGSHKDRLNDMPGAEEHRAYKANFILVRHVIPRFRAPMRS